MNNKLIIGAIKYRCIICKNVFPIKYLRARPRKYCGSQITKDGCAYKVYIAKHTEYNKETVKKYPQRVRKYWLKAQNKYRQTPRGILMHRKHALNYYYKHRISHIM